MREKSFEVRVCKSCGLRYPMVGDRAFGIRCPSCLGETNVALQKELNFEAAPSPSPTRRTGEELSVLLDNIRSAGNVGSILRSAEGFGFAHAYLCGITPTPENDAVRKTSLGAEDSVTWSYHKDAVKLVKGLKKEGMKSIALEESERAAPLTSDSLSTARNVLIVGNEITGVDPDLLDLCDNIFFIPMHGEKKSFNVAVAFGIAAYTLTASQ